MPYEWTEERLKAWSRTLKLYGLKPTELNELRKRLIVAQGYACAICGRRFDTVMPNGRKRIACLDHDHHSGALRGMLCVECNRFKVARNSRDTAPKVVVYLNDPPAYRLLEAWGVSPHSKRGVQTEPIVEAAMV